MQTKRSNLGFIKLESWFFVQIDTLLLGPYYEGRNGRMRLFSEKRAPIGASTQAAHSQDNL